MARLTVEQLHLTHAEDAAEAADAAPVVQVQQAAPQFRQGVQTKPAPRRASEAQVKFVRDLLAERSGDRVDGIRLGLNAVREEFGFLPSMHASLAIEALKKIRKTQAAVATPAGRTNRFAGKCEDCGTMVPAEEGILTKSDEGKWEVAHQAGECPVSEFPFPLGRYAVENEDGELRFLQATMEGLFFMASDELHRVPAGLQQFFVDAIAADPMAASVRYGREIEKCGRCGRTLTDKESRDAGIGPVCAKKGWDA